jgi:hypothetical protein
VENPELIESGDQPAQRGDEAGGGGKHAGDRLEPGLLGFVRHESSFEWVPPN